MAKFAEFLFHALQGISLVWGVGDTQRLERASSGAHSSTTSYTNHKMGKAPVHGPLTQVTTPSTLALAKISRMAKAAITPLEQVAPGLGEYLVERLIERRECA
jgi:hypothetical protein